MSKLIFRLILLTLFIFMGTVALVAAQQPGSPDNSLPPAIVNLSSSLTAVTLANLESHQAKTTLSWQVVNLPADDKIALQIYQRNQWGGVFPEEILPASGQREILVEPPLNFSPPTYRLSILDKDGNVLEERTLTIPYAAATDADLQPQIQSFTAEAQNVDAAQLLSHQARINVAWDVLNRPASANITFEQFLGDGTVIPIELARPYLWLSSQGQGVVAPVMPDEVDEPVRLRLRLVDMISGETYDTAEVILPLTGAATLPTSTPRPVVVVRPTVQATAAAVVGCAVSPLLVPTAGYPNDGCNTYSDGTVNVQINSFTETFAGIVPYIRMATPGGDSIQLDWNVSGVSQVLIEVYDRLTLYNTNPPAAYLLIDNQPAVGTTNVILHKGMTQGARIVLWAYDTVGGTSTAPYRRLAYSIVDVLQLQSLLTPTPSCEPHFHFTDSGTDSFGCAETVYKTQISGAYQPFERGFMLWRGDDQSIVAFSKDGWYSYYQVGSYSGLADNPVTDIPPDGKVLPVSGFGRIWGNFTNIRDALGWALTSEQSYSMTIQTSSAPFYYLTMPDGTVLKLDNLSSQWTVETP